jgi:hypothetical protein
MKRTIYGLVMAFIGLVGVGLVVFVFLTMAGISVPVSWPSLAIVFGVALSGPLMLLTGGALFSLNFRANAAAKVAFIGAIIVTLWVAGIVGAAIVQAVHPSTNPAIDSALHPGDALFYAILILTSGIADWLGYRASRMAR